MLRRIIAMATVVVMIGLVIAAFILGIMGSGYFWGIFFAAIIVPIIFWVMNMLYNIGKDKKPDEKDEVRKDIPVEKE